MRADKFLVFVVGISWFGAQAAWSADPMAGTPAVEPDTPKIQFIATEIAFGPVWSGQGLTCTAKFTNPGRAVLEIREVKPTCGCTHLGRSDTRVAPGGQGRIDLYLNTLGMAGQIKRQVRITTNVPGQEVCEVTLAGRVDPLFEPKRPELVYGRVLLGVTPPVKDLELRTVSGADARITGCRSDWEPLRAEYRSSANGVTVTAKLAPLRRPGTFRGSIWLNLDHPFKGEIRIPVIGWLDPLKLDPEEILVPIRTPGQRLPRSVRLTRMDGQALEIADVKTPLASVQIQIRPQDQPEVKVLEIELGPEAVLSAEQPQWVFVYFKDPQLSPARIPVRLSAARETAR